VAGAAETIGAESLSGREPRVEIVDGRSYVSGMEHDQRTGNLAMSSSLFSVRLSGAERALLEAAASQAGTNISDFVRRRAIEAAEVDVLEANRYHFRKGLEAVRGIGRRTRRAKSLDSRISPASPRPGGGNALRPFSQDDQCVFFRSWAERSRRRAKSGVYARW
jgi:hypothetical protein